MSGYVAALVAELHLPEARSLKQRRALLRPLLDRARQRLPVSIAESPSDAWQRVELTAAVAASTVSGAEGVLDELERMIWSMPGIDVVDTRRRWAELDE